eukprot:351773-Chlamydomonas_euryale.AAC.30
MLEFCRIPCMALTQALVAVHVGCYASIIGGDYLNVHLYEVQNLRNPDASMRAACQSECRFTFSCSVSWFVLFPTTNIASCLLFSNPLNGVKGNVMTGISAPGTYEESCLQMYNYQAQDDAGTPYLCIEGTYTVKSHGNMLKATLLIFSSETVC